MYLVGDPGAHDRTVLSHNATHGPYKRTALYTRPVVNRFGRYNIIINMHYTANSSFSTMFVPDLRPLSTLLLSCDKQRPLSMGI